MIDGDGSIWPRESRDRVSYDTGVLLDAEDFEAEQLYHRSRLAQALLWLNGFGTVAGLRVEVEGPAQTDEEKLILRPGMAVDRLGRVIVIPAEVCLRLNRWYEAQAADDLGLSFDAGSSTVVTDVFLQYKACPRGSTPAVATGPFDATDAIRPSRVRDGYRVDLVLHRQPPPPPSPMWEDLSGLAPAERRTRWKDAVLSSWDARHGAPDSEALAPLEEHVTNQDPSSVLLARVAIPTDAPVADAAPARTGADAAVDNHVRRFAYAAPALAAWSGLIPEE